MRIDSRSATAKSLQSCPTLWDPIDGSPPGSPIPGILQARTPEWVAISSSNAGKWKVKVKSLSHVWLLATSWTAACQDPPSMGFSRQEYWSRVPLPFPDSRSTKDQNVKNKTFKYSEECLQEKRRKWFLKQNTKSTNHKKNSLYYSLLKNHLTLYHEDSKR